MRRAVNISLAVCCVIYLQPLRAVADATDAASLLPPSVVAYAQLSDPPALLGTLWDHPLRKEIENLPQVLELRKRKEFQQFQLMLRFVEFQLGELWRPALAKATGGGITVAFDRSAGGAAVLINSNAPEFLQKTRDTFLELARSDAEEKEQPDPIRDIEYRGIAAHRAGEARFAVTGNWLIVTNSDDLGRSILDRLLGDDLPTLAENEAFQAAASRKLDDATLWAYVDLADLRGAGLAEDLFRGKANDFGGELILGGLLAVLKDAPHASGSLHVASDGIRLSLAAPHGGTESLAERGYFFGPNARGNVPARIEVDNQLGSIRAFRNIGDLWLRGPDLFDEGVAAQMAAAETNLANLFGGRRFGEEVLGGVHPELQLISAAQDYAATGLPEPGIKIPAFALVARLRDPEAGQRSLKIAFQTAIGFANIAAGQQGYPPLELDIERHSEATTVISATYSPVEYTPADDPAADESATGPAGRLQYNFSPTVAFAGEHFIAASTKELATEVVARLSSDAASTLPDKDEAEVVNTSIRLAVPEIHGVLTANRENLINQNMIEEGHDRAAAERETDALLKILGWISELGLEATLDNETLRLEAKLSLAE